MDRADFFVSGGTMPSDAASYVSRAADRQLLDALTNGQYAYVLNARQMGKSSLCVRTMAKLREAGIRTAFVDLTRIGGSNATAEQWYIGLLGEIGRALANRQELLAFWRENEELSPMQRFFGALTTHILEPTAPPVVVFIDEVDSTRSLRFSTDEFFGGVRECYNRRSQDPAFERLTFCLLGSAIPSDLIREAQTSPFNIGERIAIKDFTVAEAAAFAAGLGPNGAQLVSRVHYWTNGHPFLTQSLCARLAATGATRPSDVDGLVRNDLFAPSARENNVNLADVGNRVLVSDAGENPEGRRAEILAFYDRVRRGKRVEDDESNPRVAILKMAGLVVAEGGALRIRNRIYTEVFGAAWIAEHMPDGEARRVRRAYRRGIVRATLVAAAMLAVVGALGINAAYNAQRAETALVQARLDRAKAVKAEDDAVKAEKAATQSAQTATLAEQAATESTKREASARRDAQKSADKATASAKDALKEATEAHRQTLLAQSETRNANDARNRTERLLYTSNLQLVSDALAAGSGVRAAALLNESTPPDGHRSWADRHYRAILREDALLPGHLGRVGRVVFAPNGDVLTLDGFEVEETECAKAIRGLGTVRRWSTSSGRLLGSLDLRSIPGATSLDVAPDGKTVVVSMGDGTLRRYSAEDFHLLGTARGADGYVGNLHFSNLSDRVLVWRGCSEMTLSVDDAFPPAVLETHVDTAGLDNLRTVFLPSGDLLKTSILGRFQLARFDVLKGDRYAPRWSLGAVGGVIAMAVGPDGRYLAYSTNHQAVLVDAKTGVSLGRRIVHPSVIHALAFSPDGKFLATGSDDGTINVWSVPKLAVVKRVPIRHPDVTSIAFSANDSKLAIGCGDGFAEVVTMDAAAGGAGVLPVETGSISVSTAGALLVSTGDSFALKDPKTGATRRSFPIDERLAFDISKDGKTVASIGLSGRFQSWDVATGKRLVDEKTLPEDVDKDIEFGPGNVALVYVGGPGCWTGFFDPSSFALIDARSGRFVAPRHLDIGFYSFGRISPDGKDVTLARQSGRVTIYDARSGRPKFDLRGGRPDHASTLAYSPDARWLAVGRATGWIDIYDARSGRNVRSWPAHGGRVAALAISPDGQTLASLAEDQTCRMWDLQTGRSVGEEPVTDPGNEIWFGGDGNIYFAAGGAVQTRRVGGDLVPVKAAPPLPEPPPPARLLGDAEAESRRTGKPILFVLRCNQDYASSRVVDAYLSDPVAAPILKRRLVVAEGTWGGVYQANGQTSLNQDYWRQALGISGYFPYVSMYLLDAGGHVKWRAGTLGGLPAWGAIWAPFAKADIDRLIAVCRTANPAFSAGEASRVRSAVLRDQRQYELDRTTQTIDADNQRQIDAAIKANDYERAWNEELIRIRRRPLDVLTRDQIDSTYYLMPSEVAEVRAGHMANVAWQIVRQAEDGLSRSEGRLRYALTIADITQDKELERRVRAQWPTNLNALSEAYDICLFPSPDADLTKVIELIDQHQSEFAGNYWAPLLRGFVAARLGRLAFAESTIHGVMAADKADPSPSFKAVMQAVLAYTLAKEGKTAEARQTMRVAEGLASRDHSDAGLIVTGVGGFYVATIRHEIAGLLGAPTH